MRTRQIATLVGNDLRLHGTGMGGTIIALIGVLLVARLMKPDGSEVTASGMILTLNLLMVLIWGDWLVSREKTKGTIGWLRTLPVADATILIAKTATYTLSCIALWVATTMLFIPHYFFPTRWPSWFTLQCLLICAGTLSVCGRFRFHQKLGQAVPLIAIGAPLNAIIVLERLAPTRAAHLGRLATTTPAMALEAATLLALSAGLISLTARWMRRAETFELLE